MSAAPAISVNRFWHPLADTFSSALGSKIGIPRLRPSQWQVADSKSLTVSAGDGVSAVAGTFRMRVVSRTTKQVLVLNGEGAGISAGVGVLPVDVSGDPQKLAKAPGVLGGVTNFINAAGERITLPNLPGWNSPVYLGACGSDSMGQNLFAGTAVIVGAGGGLVVEFDAQSVYFLDLQIGRHLGSTRIPRDVLASHAKAMLFARGLHYLTNLAVGDSVLLYAVEVQQDTSRDISFC